MEEGQEGVQMEEALVVALKVVYQQVGFPMEVALMGVVLMEEDLLGLGR